MDARAYDDTVHNLYHSAADFEETEPAHLHLESNEVNFGSISYVWFIFPAKQGVMWFGAGADINRLSPVR